MVNEILSIIAVAAICFKLEGCNKTKTVGGKNCERVEEVNLKPLIDRSTD